MNSQFIFILKFLSAFGCGLTAGVFFAFSTFVMPALARIEPSVGISAMQSINVMAINPFFMTALFGTALTCLALIIVTLFGSYQTNVYWLIASLVYLVGTIIVTIAFNVPLNDTLAVVNPETESGRELWTKYLVDWTKWNHVRTISSLLASILFTLSFYR
ncbi:MAG: hypothetical protein N5P05_002736 [Chroococcopsis gigantea SAG 12.99]|jgi:uncharacterized membrane protein|nr:hypothetical protein [Chroococcopsis gigantea SAG 12.99]